VGFFNIKFSFCKLAFPLWLHSHFYPFPVFLQKLRQIALRIVGLIDVAVGQWDTEQGSGMCVT
jgi:hypothetical protein